ncbi:MAG TPA: secretin N-terminal domain-containing protein [bacterium]|nr:secretin N-terminal domain-containing protein [bacterium]
MKKTVVLLFLFFFLIAGLGLSKDFILNFNNVDIRTFIKLVGEYTQENYVIDPNVRGNITVYSYKAVPAGEIENIFKSILNLYGFTSVRKEGVSFIIPLTDGKTRAKDVNIGDVPPDKLEDFIIQIIPLKYYPPDTISQVLTPYISRGGQITVDGRTNSLIISDIGENIAKLQDIISKIDVPSTPGKEEMSIYRLQNADAEEVAKVLTQVLSKPRTIVRRGEVPPMQPSIVSAKATNSLIIHAEHTDLPNIEKIIKELDVLTNQVLIEAMIVEVSFDKAKEIGVELTLANTVKDGEYTASLVGEGLGTLRNTASASGFLEVGLLHQNLSRGAILRMFEKDAYFNILSTPQIMTTDNYEASINVSENIPYLKETRFIQDTSGSTSDTIRSYDYKDVGIMLKITPQISQDKYVRLKISQEVTKITGSIDGQPTTAKRSAETNLIVPNNETIVLGGLVGEDKGKSTQKVPFLGDIPLLGRLFRKDERTSVKTNLLIFITPRIMTTFEKAIELTAEKQKIIGENKK